MLVLGVETATDRLGLAIAGGDHIYAELHLDHGRRHAEQLGIGLDALLTDLGRKPADLTGIAVSIGPGSFTGLRIGLAFAKGLALANGALITGVPTLDVVAQAAEPYSGHVVACLDARRGEVYFSAYELHGGCLTPLDGGPEVGPPERVAERCRQLGGRVLLIGGGAELLRGATAIQAIDAQWAPRTLALPRAGLVATRGAERFRSGGGEEPDHVEPIYVRRSDAELRRGALASRR
jgi:tRNA threonylcarbamoyladenosine biosynthesis protein TsaB